MASVAARKRAQVLADKEAAREWDATMAAQAATTLTTATATITLAVGDVCYLKSGSPKLVIESFSGGSANVCWIIYETGLMQRDTVPVACLRKHS